MPQLPVQQRFLLLAEWADAEPDKNADPPSPQQLIAAGWGYALIDPASIQADNGAGLTKRYHRTGKQRSTA